MSKVQVWRYKVFFNHHGVVDSGRYGTEKAIRTLGGRRIEGTETSVDANALDHLGLAPVDFKPSKEKPDTQQT